MFPIQITINNIDELGKVMESLGLAEPVATPDPAPEKKSEQVKPASTQKESSAKEPSSAANASASTTPETVRDLTEKTAAEAVETLHGHAARPTPAVTYVECAKAVTDLSKAKGRDAAVAVLAQFDAKNLKEVPEDKFGDVVMACRVAMEG